MSKVIFIVGPTAVGKTDVAFKLAKEIGGEIVSCDSMLVYKESKIVTAKPDPDILSQVKHHLIDVVSVEDEYDVSIYCKTANKIIKDLISRNVPVIVCGGTGLYMKALLDGIFEDETANNEEIRIKLSQRAQIEGTEELYQELLEVDPDTADIVSPNDLKRIIRALEVYHSTGVPLSEKKKQAKGLWDEKKYSIKIFALNLDREKLYQRINLRTQKMFENGAVEEVKKLLSMNLSKTASKIIGIEQIKPFIEGKIILEEAMTIMQQHTRNYAKRQFTWFNKDKRIDWIGCESKTVEQIVEKIKTKI